MPNCTCCAEDRQAAGQPPRELHELPQEVLSKAGHKGKMFRKKELPIYLCPHCDGDALIRAVNTALKRGTTD